MIAVGAMFSGGVSRDSKPTSYQELRKDPVFRAYLGNQLDQLVDELAHGGLQLSSARSIVDRNRRAPELAPAEVAVEQLLAAHLVPLGSHHGEPVVEVEVFDHMFPQMWVVLVHQVRREGLWEELPARETQHREIRWVGRRTPEAL